MLLRDGNRIARLEYNRKTDTYGITIRWDDGTQHVKTFTVEGADWRSNDHNELRSWLINHNMSGLWDQLQENHVDPIDVILSKVTACKNYGVQTGMDIFFGDNVFRLHEKDYILSANFEIWYLATMQRIASINSKEEWQDFVGQCLHIAESVNYDPLEPDIIGGLVEAMKQSPDIHSQFCDALYAMIKGTPDTAYFVVDKENATVYVPKSVTTFLAQREKLSRKRVRQFLKPYLVRMDDMRMYIGKKLKPRILARFWLLSVEKLADYDAGAMETMISKMKDCDKECELEEQEVEEIVG